jgi:hypothetical protein
MNARTATNSTGTATLLNTAVFNTFNMTDDPIETLLNKALLNTAVFNTSDDR